MNVITCKNVTKTYTLSHNKPTFVKRIFFPSKQKNYSPLHNISFTVKTGETVGIIGENGSGKSTILKLISGIIQPTKGEIKVRGKIASLIELGAGFHPDLTGRENILLNGILLGDTKKEIQEKITSIIQFADIGKYIDEPIRTYSSGMTVRIGFSTAIHTNPDILLIDEVLAVGDESFQKKCISAIKTFQQKNKTIVIVSHDLSLINLLSTKVLLIDNANKLQQGDPQKMIEAYQGQRKNFTSQTALSTKKSVAITDVRILKNNKNVKTIKSKDKVTIQISYNSQEKINNPLFGISIHHNNEIIAGPNMYSSDSKLRFIQGKGIIDCNISSLPLLSNTYTVSAIVCDRTCRITYDYLYNACTFTVVGDRKFQSGYLHLPTTWKQKS